MIQYIEHQSIDKKKWDDCISHSFNGNMYAFSWYLDIVHNQWEALVENDYERVMPLTGAKKFGIWYLFQPYFTQQLGVFSNSILNAEIVGDLLAHIPVKYQFAQINLNVHNRPSSGNYQLLPQKNYLLDMIYDYPKLAAKYSVNARRNIKKAKVSGSVLMKGLRPELLIDLFRNNKGKQVNHWKTKHYLILQRLMYTALHKGVAAIYGVYAPDNELCAGAFFLKSHQHLIFLFSATNTYARKNGIMSFLLDVVIEEWSSSQMILDFEGSNNIELARFYKSFGAKEVSYNRLDFNRLSFPLRQFVQLKNKWKG